MRLEIFKASKSKKGRSCVFFATAACEFTRGDMPYLYLRGSRLKELVK